MRTKFCPRCGSHDVERRIIVGQTAKERRTCRSCGYVWEYTNYDAPNQSTAKTPKHAEASQPGSVAKPRHNISERWLTTFFIVFVILLAISPFVVSACGAEDVGLILFLISYPLIVVSAIVYTKVMKTKMHNTVAQGNAPKKCRPSKTPLTKEEEASLTKKLVAWMIYAFACLSFFGYLMDNKAAFGFWILYFIAIVFAGVVIWALTTTEDKHDALKNQNEYSIYIAQWLEKMGFKGIELSRNEDQQGTFLRSIAPNGNKTLILCKFGNSIVEADAIAHLVDAWQNISFQVSSVVMIASMPFSNDAKNFAQQRGIHVVENFKAGKCVYKGISYDLLNLYSKNTQNQKQNHTPNEPFYHDCMTGVEYEKFVCYRLTQMGYKDVKMTKASDDNGADILAVTPDGHTIAIQCKKYRDHVGKPAVYEAISARDYYYRSQAAVITNSVFTRQAKEFAKRTGVILVENFK